MPPTNRDPIFSHRLQWAQNPQAALPWGDSSNQAILLEIEPGSMIHIVGKDSCWLPAHDEPNALTVWRYKTHIHTPSSVFYSLLHNCHSYGFNPFVKSLFLRQFTICWDRGSIVLVWIVTGLLWSVPSGRIYWNLKLISRCRLSSTWWLCRGIRWKSMTITLLTRSRWMSFSSKLLTNRGLQVMKDNIVMILLFFSPFKI